MKPTVKEDPKWAQVMIRLKLITKRGAEVIVVSGFFGLVTAWILAGLSAFYRWGDSSEAGWIVIWCIISAIVVGIFVGLDDSKEGK